MSTRGGRQITASIPNICVIFTGGPGPDDRGWNANPKQKDAMRTYLAKAEQELGNVELLIGESSGVDQTAALLKRAGPTAPVLAINLQCFALKQVVQPILDGKDRRINKCRKNSVAHEITSSFQQASR